MVSKNVDNVVQTWRKRESNLFWPGSNGNFNFRRKRAERLVRLFCATEHPGRHVSRSAGTARPVQTRVYVLDASPGVGCVCGGDSVPACPDRAHCTVSTGLPADRDLYRYRAIIIRSCIVLPAIIDCYFTCGDPCFLRSFSTERCLRPRYNIGIRFFNFYINRPSERLKQSRCSSWWSARSVDLSTAYIRRSIIFRTTWKEKDDGTTVDSYNCNYYGFCDINYFYIYTLAHAWFNNLFYCSRSRRQEDRQHFTPSKMYPIKNYSWHLNDSIVNTLQAHANSLYCNSLFLKNSIKIYTLT